MNRLTPSARAGPARVRLPSMQIRSSSPPCSGPEGIGPAWDVCRLTTASPRAVPGLRSLRKPLGPLRVSMATAFHQVRLARIAISSPAGATLIAAVVIALAMHGAGWLAGLHVPGWVVGTFIRQR